MEITILAENNPQLEISKSINYYNYGTNLNLSRNAAPYRNNIHGAGRANKLIPANRVPPRP